MKPKLLVWWETILLILSLSLIPILPGETWKIALSVAFLIVYLTLIRVISYLVYVNNRIGDVEEIKNILKGFIPSKMKQ